MADAQQLPLRTALAYFKWSRPAAPNPRLAAPIDADDTTITFTSAPQNQAGTIITTPFLMGIRNSASYVETVYCPNGANGASGLSATGCIRGIDLAGIDFTEGDTAFAASHEQDSPVFCNVTAVLQSVLVDAVQGLVATGGTVFRIGANAAGTVTVQRSSGAGTGLGFLRWNTATSAAEFSNDGAVWNRIDNITGSNLVVISAADTTPGNLNDKIVGGDGIATSILNPAGNEDLNLAVDLAATPGLEFTGGQLRARVNATGGVIRDANGLGVDLTQVDVVAGPVANVLSDITATEAEINTPLDGVSANVTAANLNTLTAGVVSNADALHTHTSLLVQSYTAYEAITADDAVALLPVEIQYYAQLVEADIALGDSNVRRRYAIRIVPTVTTSTLTTMLFRAREQVGGATAVGNLTISIQTDAAGAPSGTVITNGTANAITQATQQGWTVNYANRTATWAAAPTLTAGTTYWIVFECAATNAVNYLNIGVNSTYDENYVTFTRSTFNLDTGTWGGAVTNATPFFWFNNQLNLLGMAVVQCDANFGGRTWPFIGFAQTTVAAFASVAIETLFATLTGLTPGLDYWLSATAGAITTTKPNGLYGQNFAYKIGRAVSTTGFRIELGTKRIHINEHTVIDANTTRQYILWFRTDFVQVVGYSDSGTIAGLAAISFGTWDTTSNTSMQLSATNGGAFETSTDTLDSLRLDTTASANDMQARASGLTNIGFTYIFTENVAGSAFATLICTA